MDTKPSILVIDDEADNFDVVEALLHGEGYTLHYASSGQRAIAPEDGYSDTRLDSLQPDAILLDVMMPDMDGVEVCRRIKATPRWRAIPVIVVTALTNTEDMAQCLEAGAHDFISKPLGGVELRARVRSALRVKQQYDDLQAMLKLREDMVNMMVHDLRNPLACILLSTEVLRLPTLTPEKLQRKVAQIADAGSRMAASIDDLLVMAKWESNRVLLDRQEVNLWDLCMKAIDDFEAIATQKQITLVGEVPENRDTVWIDPLIFRRVLDNLLSNAIKFSPECSKVNLKVTHSNSNGIQLQVADTGKGINNALKERIFEKYEIGTPMSGIKQIGLGLAFCKMAVEAHGGTITVEDNQPQGAVFVILLPES